MYSDKTIWLRVEEVVKKHDSLEVGFTNEVKQKCKFVRVTSSDKEFDRSNIYVIATNALRRHKVDNGYGLSTEYFIHKDNIDLVLIGESRNYTSIIDVKSNKLCDEHRGIPKVEYI